MQVLGPVYLFGILGFYFIPKVNRKQFAVLYCVILALVAFSFQPGIDDDLRREYENLQGIQQYGWRYFDMRASQWDEAGKFDGLYLTQLYYYIMSYLPVYNFFPAITTFIVYLLQFNLVEKICLRYNLSKVEIWIMYVFVLSTRETYMIMSGIRNQLAFTIFGYFLYIDLIEKRNKITSFVMYFLTIFIHQSTLFLIGFRLACLFKKTWIRIIAAIILLFWSELLDKLNSFLSAFSSSEIISTVLYKINIYTVNNGGNADNIILTTRYLIYMIAWIPIILMTFYHIIRLRNIVFSNKGTNIPLNKRIYYNRGKIILRKFQYKLDVSEKDSSDICWFLIYVICFAIGAYMYYWIYLRACIMLGVVGMVPCAQVFFKNRKNGINNKCCSAVVLSLSFIKLVIIMLVMNRSMAFDLFEFITR